jgi:hypothetical protein
VTPPPPPIPTSLYSLSFLSELNNVAVDAMEIVAMQNMFDSTHPQHLDFSRTDAQDLPPSLYAAETAA